MNVGTFNFFYEDFGSWHSILFETSVVQDVFQWKSKLHKQEGLQHKE